MPACFDPLNTGRPLLPPTLDFVNSNLSSNPFRIKGLQLYENVLLRIQTTIHKTCQAALLALYFCRPRPCNPWSVLIGFLLQASSLKFYFNLWFK